MSALQGPGWEDQVVLSDYNAVCEYRTSCSKIIALLIKWMLAGMCIWYAPQVLANWLDVRLSDIVLPFLDAVLIRLR